MCVDCPLVNPFSKAFKLIIALPFVPEDLLPSAWRHLKPTLPDDMRTFIDNYEQTWVDRLNSYRTELDSLKCVSCLV
jgi:hypothetical protein